MMLEHLDSVEGSLICPFTTQEEPDLSKLRCGHFVSLKEWEKYENLNTHRDRGLPCPLCKKEVKEVGAVLPVENVKRVMNEVKENCEWLKYTFSWDSREPYNEPPSRRTRPHRTRISVSNGKGKVPDLDAIRITRPPSPRNDSASQVLSNASSFTDEIPEFGKLGPGSATGSISSYLHSPTTPTSPPVDRNSSKKRTKKPVGSSIHKPDEHIDSRPGSDTLRSLEQILSQDDRGRRHEPSSTSSSRAISKASTMSTRRDSQASIISDVGSVVQSIKKTEMSVVNLGQKKTIYQDTAISASGHVIALIDLYNFTILSVPKDAELKFAADFPVICYGANDGQFGNSKSVLSGTGPLTPKYVRAVMSDRSLCIACQEGYIDVRDAKTGRRLRRIDSSVNCNIAMSPNGEILALAMNSGELQVFSSGPEWDFNTTSFYVIGEAENPKLMRFVKCMAFSPSSVYLAACTSDNVIRTYKLDMKTNSSTLMSTHVWGDVVGYGVTDLALYNSPVARLIVSTSNSRSLLAVAYASKVYPVVLKNVTSRNEDVEVMSLVNNDKDCNDYTDKNCCVAYSPIANVALIIPLDGPVKLVNCALGKRGWNIDKMMNEKMDGEQPWLDCSLIISNDGLLGLALDRRGKLVLVRFIVQ